MKTNPTDENNNNFGFHKILWETFSNTLQFGSGQNEI